MVKISLDLRALGYSYQAEYKIWSRDAPSVFNYSDGDSAENKIHEIIREAHDVSVFSRELRAACTDWVTHYHLSAARTNLLRPLSQRLKGRVLEIGAGCGAITRFLGENGSDVVAIEGSRRRAIIAAERTRDLSNVVVLHEDFSEFNPAVRFDAVTLIGVLEYAGCFGKDADPVQHMLESARRLLKPDGVLIIAIENQLGLKYFAGAPEDHLNVPMVGIQGLYKNPGVQTFGYQELQQRIKDAGFKRVDLALPFPDYKMPVSIVLSEACDSKRFNVSELAAQAVARDKQISSENLNFSMECAWRVIEKNGLLCDLSNSFLLMATPNRLKDSNLFDDGAFACHYSIERQPSFCKAVEFFSDGLGNISVKHKLINSPVTPIALPLRYTHTLPNDQYVQGEALSEKPLRDLYTPGWTAKQIANFLAEYLKIVLSMLETKDIEIHRTDLTHRVPGALLDAIPQNIILSTDGPVIIDQEWSSETDIPLAYLTFRALTTLIRSGLSFALPSDMRWLKQGRLFQDVFAHLGFDLTKNDYDEFAMLEADFMTFVSGTTNEPIPYNDWAEHNLPSFVDRAGSITRPLRESIGGLQSLADTYLAQIKWLESENSRRQQSEKEYLNQIRWLEGENTRRQEHIQDTEAQISRIDDELRSIYRSRSWKVVKRLRFLYNSIRIKSRQTTKRL